MHAFLLASMQNGGILELLLRYLKVMGQKFLEEWPPGLSSVVQEIYNCWRKHSTGLPNPLLRDCKNQHIKVIKSELRWKRCLCIIFMAVKASKCFQILIIWMHVCKFLCGRRWWWWVWRVWNCCWSSGLSVKEKTVSYTQMTSPPCKQIHWDWHQQMLLWINNRLDNRILT